MKFLFPVCFFWLFSLSGSIDYQYITINRQILKKSITVKWQCPEFKGNESYAFKLLRTESKNGQPGDDWTEVATVNVTDKGKTQYEYTDTRDLKLCPTYI